MKTLNLILPLKWQFSQLALEKAFEAILAADAMGNIFWVNEAACRYLGYSREELTRMKVFDVNPNYTPQIWFKLTQKIKNNGVLVYESCHRAKNGKILPIEIAANHFEFKGRDYYCAFVRSITRHKKSEQRLRDRSEHQLELFFSQSLDGFFFMMLDEPVSWNDAVDKEKVLDYVFEHQRITKVNDAMLAQYGATPEQFIGYTPNDFFLHDIQHGRKVWREFFDAGRLHVETDERKLDGTPIWIEGDYICFYDNQGRVTGHFGIQRDVTERKQAALQEAELKAQVERYAAALENQNINLREEIHNEHNFGEIIGASKVMEQVFDKIEMVSETDSTVLLTGETGTGKELIARAIHSRSSRKNHTMIKVNCGAIPSGLVESELFGHEKGAFTGAMAQKQGKFELAHRGTIFLDEIGELPLEIQVKLLRVLQEQEFERLGGSQTIRVDVRVITATNRDLQMDVKRGAFRSDLFFRIDIFPIQIPPLRARKDDIPLLANFFIAKFSRRLGKRIHSINLKPMETLTNYHWPGNVRELANILERAVILCRGNVLRNEHIVGLTNLGTSADKTPLTLAEAERQHILQVLQITNGIIGGPNGAAAILGLNRSTLRSRMQKLGIAVLKEVS
jgi:PAS domain S-box-containing protein